MLRKLKSTLKILNFPLKTQPQVLSSVALVIILLGKIFNSTGHKKVSFFRHIKEMNISTSLRGVDFDYWTSATMAKGILLTIKGNFVFSGKYNAKLIDLQDGLTRRLEENKYFHSKTISKLFFSTQETPAMAD